jgi:hypothetical protein
LAWLAAECPNHDYLGTDVYPEVIAFCRDAHPEIAFETCAAKDLPALLESKRDRSIVVLSSGSLQYVQPEHLQQLFRALVAFPGIGITLSEPASLKNGPPEQLHGSRWRANFSYSHDYRWYAEKAGWTTGYCHVVAPYTDLDTVQYNYETVLPS